MNKRILIIPLLLTLLTVPYLTVQIQIVQASFEGSFESLPRYYESFLPFDYLIDNNSTNTFMFNGTTHKMDWSNTDQDSILQGCIGNLTDGGTIKVVGDIIFDYINIPYDNIILSGNKACFKFNQSGTPQIKHLNYTTEGSHLDNGVIENFYIGEMILRPNSAHHIRGLVFRDCAFSFTRAGGWDSKGIVMNSTSYPTGQTYYADFITFEHCSFKGSPEAEYALVNFMGSGGGTSNWWWIHCDFFLQSNDDQVFFKWWNNGFGSRMKVTDSVIYATGVTNNTLCYFPTTDYSGSRNCGIDFTGNSIEIHNNVTYVRVDNGDNDQRFVRVNFLNNRFSAFENGFLINNTEGTFDESSYVKYVDNSFDPSVSPLGTLHLSTPNDSANFRVYLDDNTGYNPIGNVTSCVSGTYLFDSNSEGTIQNNTEYTVTHSPKAIYMGDGSTFDVYVNGELVFDDVTQAMVNLVQEETFKVEHDGTMNTLVVHAQ